MATYALAIGTTLTIRGVRYAVVNRLEDGRLQFRQPETSELLTLSRPDLLSLYATNEAEFELRGLPTPGGGNWFDGSGKMAFSAVPEKLRQVAERRERYVKAVLAAGPKRRDKLTLDPIIASCSHDETFPDPSPPGWLSVYRWVKRYVASGHDIRSLLDQRASQGNHIARVKGVVRELTVQAIDEVYLTPERPTKGHARLHLQHLINIANKQRPPSQKLTCPSVKYLTKVLLEEFDPYTITERRYGKLAAEREFRGAVGRQERPTRPMERVELDHTILDLIAVDDHSFVLLGRPVIAFAVDTLTRCIAGFSLGFQHPSASTLAACVKHAVLPKTYIQAMYPNINHAWECMGNIETLVLDRGLENLGRRIASAGRQNGMDIEYTKRRSGWGKGIVERLIRSCNDDLIHLMPGTTFSNVLERADYVPSKHAVITKSALRAILHKWVIDVYQETFHRGIRDTPAHKWQVEAAGCAVYLPRSARDLDIAFGVPENQTLWHYGIEINGLRYNNDLMLDLRRRIGNEQDVDFMWYEENLGYVDVLDPVTNEYLRVNCVEYEYANGLTLYQHKINRAYAKEHFEGRVDVAALADAKAEIREMIKKTISSKRGTTRKRQARYQEGAGFQYPQDVAGNGEAAPEMARSSTNAPAGKGESPAPTEGTQPNRRKAGFKPVPNERSRMPEEYLDYQVEL